MLAALDRLEQERIVGVLGDLEKRRDRCEQIGHDLLADRHERSPLRQFLELVEARDLHTSTLTQSDSRAPFRRRAHHSRRRC